MVLVTIITKCCQGLLYSTVLLLLIIRPTEEFFMSKSDVFHLGLTKNDL
ncbi:uridine phosphorylase, partial [Acinetobacter baumannii]|nr:uridine phosphorylase [Acinetobacter baumannii]